MQSLPNKPAMCDAATKLLFTVVVVVGGGGGAAAGGGAFFLREVDWLFGCCKLSFVNHDTAQPKWCL